MVRICCLCQTPPSQNFPKCLGTPGTKARRDEHPWEVEARNHKFRSWAILRSQTGLAHNDTVSKNTRAGKMDQSVTCNLNLMSNPYG